MTPTFLYPRTGRRRNRELPGLRHRHPEDVRLHRIQSRNLDVGRRRQRQIRWRTGKLDLAEGALRKACDRLGIKATVTPDEAAFSRPKIDMKLVDRHRSPVAALHGAVRFHSAEAVRARIHRRGWQEAPSGHGAPRPVRSVERFFRYSDRALRGRVSGMARPGAGHGFADHDKQSEYAEHVSHVLKPPACGHDRWP